MILNVYKYRNRCSIEKGLFISILFDFYHYKARPVMFGRIVTVYF